MGFLVCLVFVLFSCLLVVLSTVCVTDVCDLSIPVLQRHYIYKHRYMKGFTMEMYIHHPDPKYSEIRGSFNHSIDF